MSGSSLGQIPNMDTIVNSDEKPETVAHWDGWLRQIRNLVNRGQAIGRATPVSS